MVVLAFLGPCLRTLDNPALYHAIQQAAKDKSAGAVVAFYVEDPTQRLPGKAFTWWTRKSLPKLRKQLEELRVPLFCLRAPYPRIAEVLVSTALSFSAVHVNRRWGGTTQDEDTRFAEIWAHAGIEQRVHTAHTLHEPWEIQTGQGQPYRVYTAFSKHFANISPQLLEEPPCAPEDEDGQAYTRMEHALTEQKDITVLDWARPSSEFQEPWAAAFPWTPGSDEAHRVLQAFVDHTLATYKDARDIPFEAGTSRLSPYLAHGEISPHRVLSAVRRARSAGSTSKSFIESTHTFERELVWREFNYHLLYHQPDLATRNHNVQWDAFSWAEVASPAQLKEEKGCAPASSDAMHARAMYDCWRSGHTGIPLVDAGMRQLWKMGWMHNRVRMVVASFLVKNLRIHWRLGEEWFWDTLVDADPASNPGNWQWVAGTGADAAPFFRIFNPARQADRFDERCAYVRQWVDELKSTSTSDIAEMYEHPKRSVASAMASPSPASLWVKRSNDAERMDMPKASLFRPSMVAMAEPTYRAAMVDLKKSRSITLEYYQKRKNSSESPRVKQMKLA